MHTQSKKNKEARKDEEGRKVISGEGGLGLARKRGEMQGQERDGV